MVDFCYNVHMFWIIIKKLFIEFGVCTLIAWILGMPLFIKGVIGEKDKEYK